MRIIAGKYAGRRLKAPKGPMTRPTAGKVREGLFNILQHWQPHFFVKKTVLDLFAGTGALGFEALSRGASRVSFVEKNKQVREILKENTKNLGLEACVKIIASDATKILPFSEEERFDIVFIDPPYGKGWGERALNLLALGGCLNKGALIILEEEASSVLKARIPFALQQERRYGNTILRFFNAEAESF